MGKPTEQELRTALAEAASMRERGADSHYLAKALLNLHYRQHYLEQVLVATERFLAAGMDASNHARVLQAIARYHAADERSAAAPHPELWLDH